MEGSGSGQTCLAPRKVAQPEEVFGDMLRMLNALTPFAKGLAALNEEAGLPV